MLIRAQRHVRFKLCHQTPFRMTMLSWPAWMHQRGVGDYPTTVGTKRQIFLCEPRFRIICCAIGSLVLWSSFSLARERSRADHFKVEKEEGSFQGALYTSGVPCFQIFVSLLGSLLVLSNLFFFSSCPIYRTRGVEKSTKHR